MPWPKESVMCPPCLPLTEIAILSVGRFGTIRASGDAVNGQGLLEITFTLPGICDLACFTKRCVSRNGFLASPGLSGIGSAWMPPCSRPAGVCPGFAAWPWGPWATWSSLCRGAWLEPEVLRLTWAPRGGRTVPAARELSQARAAGR